MAKARRIILETRVFEKAGDASAHFSAILNKYSVRDRVSEADASDLFALLKRHDEMEEKVGTGVAYFEVNLPPDEYPKHSKQCFWIVRTDGTKIDFSIGHCLERKPYDA